jgi:multiple sugar transport system substrate-binding protein
MSTSQRPLLVLGRAFDGFSRALSRQLGIIAGEGATFELPEILELADRIVVGDEALSGRVDLLMVVTDWLPALIATGKILPLDEFFAELPPEGWPEAWHPALRELQRGPDGRTYGVPYHVGPQMLLYRADLYEDPAERQGFTDRFGYPLAAPDTWAQYRDQARWFTRPADGRYGTIIAGYPEPRRRADRRGRRTHPADATGPGGRIVPVGAVAHGRRRRSGRRAVGQRRQWRTVRRR